MKIFPLVRKFAPVPEEQQQEGLPLDEVVRGLGGDSLRTWDDLLKEPRVVILAEAGAGKTFELRSAAQRVCDEGKPGFFLRLEQIGEGLHSDFEIGTNEAFQEWLASSGQGWFFLDAIDEIRLTETRSFEHAIRIFSKKIGPARHRANICIAGRPYAWRPELDRALIDELLPISSVTMSIEEGDIEQPKSSVVEGAVSAAANILANEMEERRTVRLYLMLPLDDESIRYFADNEAVTDSSKFLDELSDAAMVNHARLPFDLGYLIEMWLSKQQLPARLLVLQGGVTQMLADKSVSSVLPLARAMDGARLIAISVILTGKSNVGLSNLSSAGAIDPQQLLQGWTLDEIQHLLLSGIFGEPVYGQVRFRHREIYELLAAEWIFEQYRRRGGRERLEPYLFRSQYGEEIVTPRTRPVLPWLILFDEITRRKIIDSYPEIATEGGDASSLPLEVRSKMLLGLMDRFAEVRSSVRGLDNAAIARIARPDLQDLVSDLLDVHYDDDDAIFLLARLAWQGKMSSCAAKLADIAAQPSRNENTRAVCARAVSTVGTELQLHELWEALINDTSKMPRRLFAELVDRARPSQSVAGLIVNSIDNLKPYERYETTGVVQALIGFINRVPNTGSDEDVKPLRTLMEGLKQYIRRQPYIQSVRCEVSEVFQWLLNPALRIVERFAEVKSPYAMSDASLNILAAIPAARFWRGDNIGERRSSISDLLGGWNELNDTLYWWTVKTYREKLAPSERFTDDWQVSWVGHFWSFTGADFERVASWLLIKVELDDRLVALSRAIKLYRDNGSSSDWLSILQSNVAGSAELKSTLAQWLNPLDSADAKEHQLFEKQSQNRQRSHEAKEARNKAEWISALTTDPDQIRNTGLGSGEFSTAQYYLMTCIEAKGELKKGQSRGTNWQALTPDFGLAVAEAYRDAAIDFWRAYEPRLRSEGAEGNSVPYALIFGMAGLDLELSKTDRTYALSDSDIRRALRYVPWELNGFPHWFEKLFDMNHELAIDFLWQEICWELEQPTAEQPLIYILNDIVYHAPWLQRHLASRILDWLSFNNAGSEAALSDCRSIMINGGVSQYKLEELCLRKISSDNTPHDQLALWYAIAVDISPGRGLPAVEKYLSNRSSSESASFGREFIVSLMGGRREVGPVIGFFRTPTYLKDLYLLIHRIVRVEDDIHRVGGGVYSPTIQDDAQEARERIVAALENLAGQPSYHALCSLLAEHPVPAYRQYMKAYVRRRVVKDGDLLDWSAAEVRSLSDDLKRMPLRAEGL